MVGGLSVFLDGRWKLPFDWVVRMHGISLFLQVLFVSVCLFVFL